MTTNSAPIWELPTLVDHLDDLLDVNGKRVLDVGCGSGWLVRRMSDAGAEVIGVEVDDHQLQRAIVADPGRSDRYFVGGAQDLPFDDDSFDVVVFSYSLHHVPGDQLVAAIGEAARVTASGGMVHFVEPVATGLGHQVDALVDDETQVRADAQAALDRVAPSFFDEIDTLSTTLAESYDDFADYETQLVGVDPTRAQRMGERREQIEQSFLANAAEHDGRYWFEGHLLTRSFTRR